MNTLRRAMEEWPIKSLHPTPGRGYSSAARLTSLGLPWLIFWRQAMKSFHLQISVCLATLVTLGTSSVGHGSDAEVIREGFKGFNQIDQRDNSQRIEFMNRLGKSLTWEQIRQVMEKPNILSEEEQEFFSNDLLMFTQYMWQAVREYKGTKDSKQRIMLYSALLRHPDGKKAAATLDIDFSDLKELAQDADAVWASRAALLRSWLYSQENNAQDLRNCLNRLQKLPESPYRKLLASRLSRMLKRTEEMRSK